MLTRRHLIQSAAASAGAAPFAAPLAGLLLPGSAAAQAPSGEAALPEGANLTTPDGDFGIIVLGHASLILTTPAGVVMIDPVLDPASTARYPEPDLILITHEHGDHFSLPTLETVAGESVPLVVNAAVAEKLPDTLKSRASVLGNGEATGILGGQAVLEAVPAYNTTADRLGYHPKGRDNGYVLNFGGTRIYVAGDTEDIPEMRALENIHIAFVPMNLPYTMTIEQAASAVNEFRPVHVYPYHYRGQDPQAFAALVTESEVGLLRWYPG